MVNVFVNEADEMGFESTLIPHGRLVLFTVIKGEDKTTQKQDKMINCECAVKEGPYASSKFYDNIMLTGSDYAVNLGKMKMQYILEHSTRAHESKDVIGAYNVPSAKFLEGKGTVAKIGIETYQNKDGEWRYRNKVLAYGTPRPTSRNHQIYAEYMANKQPYETADKPALPTNATRAAGGAPNHDLPPVDAYAL